jgi:RNA polymerase sigma-70 factor (ECF subfamily)
LSTCQRDTHSLKTAATPRSPSAKRLWHRRIHPRLALTSDSNARGPAVSETAARYHQGPGPLKPERVERHARAVERADAEALADLPAEAAIVLEMPPVPTWSRGGRAYREFMHHLLAWRGTEWQTRLVSANGQPALLLAPEEPAAHTPQTFDAGRARCYRSVLACHDPRLFALFETSHPPRR